MTFDAYQADQLGTERRDMVERLRSHGIRDERLLRAMQQVPRHRFEPEFVGGSSYQECAWPISDVHTVRRPYYVARACELAEISDGDRALVIGAGVSFSAAVLSRLCKSVVQFELLDSMAQRARRVHQESGIANIEVVTRRGENHAVPAGPYDVIVLEASVPQPPSTLVDELAPGGRLVMPLGQDFLQNFVVLRKTESGVQMKRFESCVFEPLRRSEPAPALAVRGLGLIDATH